MDGIHDLGGMHGFGRVVAEPDEPVFHAGWEARMFALASALPYALGFGDDQFRTAIEAMAPAHYLSSSYYEKWLEAVARIAVDLGAIGAGELRDPAGELVRVPPSGHAIRAEAVEAAIAAGASQSRPGATAAAFRFRTGQRVRTRATGRAGHTRLPRYARGRCGVIERVHGAFLVADRNSRGDTTPEVLYTVRFGAPELWGAEAAAGDAVSLDLWDGYLEDLA